MIGLRQEIRSLIHRMEMAGPAAGSVEAMALERLQALCGAAERAQQAGEVTPLFLELQQFWLHSIGWCSQLSKDIERLLILHDELTTGV